MTVLRNNFDGGPDGTTITTGNSGQVPGNDAFDGAATAGSGVLKYAAAFARPTAEFTMQSATGAATGQSYVYWYTSMGTQTQIWMRCYAYYSTLPNNPNSPTLFYTEGVSGGSYFLAYDTNSGQLMILNSVSTVLVRTTTTIPAGAWFRVEARVQYSATTGNGDLRLYLEADSDTPTETISFSNANLVRNDATVFYWGYISSDSNLEDLYVSGIELNNTGWPGPAPFRAGKSVPGIQPNPIAIHTDIW